MKALKTMKSQLIESCPPPKDNSNIITITQRLDSSAVYDLAKKLANEKIVTLNLPGADLAIDDLLILSGSLKKCTTLKHIDLSGNTKIFTGRFRDGSMNNAVTIETLFAENQLETLNLSKLNYCDSMFNYFMTLITSQTNLKHLTMSCGDLNDNIFQLISSKKI